MLFVKRTNALGNCPYRPPHWQRKCTFSRRTGRERMAGFPHAVTDALDRLGGRSPETAKAGALQDLDPVEVCKRYVAVY